MVSQEMRRTAMVFARPGYEVGLFGWLERLKPTVHILVAESAKTPANDDDSALTVAARRVAQTGSSLGAIFGRYTVAGALRSLQSRDIGRWLFVVDELAEQLVEGDFEWVVGEAREGFDPLQDICRLLVDAACAKAGWSKPNIRNFEYHRGAVLNSTAKPQALELEGPVWKRKMLALRDEMKRDQSVRERLDHQGWEPYRTEKLFTAKPWAVPQTETEEWADPLAELSAALRAAVARRPNQAVA